MAAAARLVVRDTYPVLRETYSETPRSSAAAQQWPSPSAAPKLKLSSNMGSVPTSYIGVYVTGPDGMRTFKPGL